MDDLFALRVFVEVADCGSLVNASATLGVSASGVGKNLSRLEHRVGVRLFHRNTRSVTLTPEGARFLERCRRIIAEIDAAHEEFSETTTVPSGRLRVSLPMLGEPFISALGSFQKVYPRVVLDADFTDRSVNLIEEGYDAALRSGELDDSRLSSKKLGDYKMLLLASPDYLTRHGTPQKPEDLLHHACIQLRYPDTGKIQPWNLFDANGPVNIALPTTLVCSSVEARMAFAETGIGIVYTSDFSAQSRIISGRLVPVLEGYSGVNGVIRIIWSSARHVSPKLRAFIDHMSRALTFRS